MKADASQSFEEFLDTAEKEAKIVAFVEDQLECSRPKTRKAARAIPKRRVW